MTDRAYIEVQGDGGNLVTVRVVAEGMPDAEIRLTRQAARAAGAAMVEGRSFRRRFAPDGERMVDDGPPATT